MSLRDEESRQGFHILILTVISKRVRQYRTRVSQWGLDKNVKPQEMKAIVRKRQTRKLVDIDKKPLHFEIRGNSVEPKKVDGWMKRNNVQENILYHPSPAAGKWGLEMTLIGRHLT